MSPWQLLKVTNAYIVNADMRFLQEGNTFCTTLEPRLFTIDLNTVEHKVFFTEVRDLNSAKSCSDVDQKVTLTSKTSHNSQNVDK